MVFGHETTSHDLNLTGNNFIYAGCVQPRGDRAGIAFMSVFVPVLPCSASASILCSQLV